MRYLLIDGQGNGSVVEIVHKAMRYTEQNVRKISEEILADIDKNC
jgi:DNA gyrase/topoisomerase IV subunit A